jgi:hypothetical protein
MMRRRFADDGRIRFVFKCLPVDAGTHVLARRLLPALSGI